MHKSNIFSFSLFPIINHYFLLYYVLSKKKLNLILNTLKIDYKMTFGDQSIQKCIKLSLVWHKNITP